MPYKKGSIIYVASTIPKWAQKNLTLEKESLMVKENDRLIVRRRLGSGWIRVHNFRTQRLNTLRVGNYLTDLSDIKDPIKFINNYNDLPNPVPLNRTNFIYEVKRELKPATDGKTPEIFTTIPFDIDLPRIRKCVSGNEVITTRDEIIYKLNKKISELELELKDARRCMLKDVELKTYAIKNPRKILISVEEDEQRNSDLEFWRSSSEMYMKKLKETEMLVIDLSLQLKETKD